MRTSELSGAALDWAVVQAEGQEHRIVSGLVFVPGGDNWNPSSNWAQAGPIIELEGISLNRVTDALWEATIMGEWTEDGPTPLVAAMRCYIGSKLGNEVEIPEALIEVCHE